MVSFLIPLAQPHIVLGDPSGIIVKIYVLLRNQSSIPDRQDASELIWLLLGVVGRESRGRVAASQLLSDLRPELLSHWGARIQ